MADINQWQLPRNEASKLLGWSNDGRGMVNKGIGEDIQAHSDNLDTLAEITPGDAGTSILALSLAADVRNFLDTAPYVATRTALKALDPTKDAVAILTEDGRLGRFIWKSGDYSSAIAGDPQEGIYLKAGSVASSAGAWVRDYDGPVIVTWFGASTAGSAAANTTAIQAAIDLTAAQSGVARRTLRLPAGQFSFTNLTVPHTATQFVLQGDGKFATVLWRPTFSADVAIRVKGEGVQFQDLSIQMTSTGNNVALLDSTAILVKKDYGTVVEGSLPTADSDFSMDNVRITRFGYGVEHWGRGFNTSDCDINLCGWSYKLEWPNASDYLNDPDPVQLDSTGFRYFQHNRLRFHSNSFGGFLNSGTNAAKINGISVTNVNLDIGRRLWQGVLARAEIVGFNCQQTLTEAFNLTDGSKDYRIADGVIRGDVDANRQPSVAIQMSGAHDNATIESLSIINTTSHGINHDGTGICTDLDIHDILFVDVCKTTAGANPIRIGGASHTGMIDDIVVSSSIALAGVVRGTASSNAMKVGRVTNTGSVHVPPLDPASLGFRMANDFYTSAATAGNFANFRDHNDTVRGTVKASGSSSVRIWLNEASDVWYGIGSGTPEAVETAGRGSVFVDIGAGANMYIKSTTSGNTGWKLVTRAA